MDVGSWLRGLGLGQYEAAFRENAIDDTVLPNLTAEDLKDLGVGIVGHRRKLLDAIAALRADASGQAQPPDAHQATDITAKGTAERRQVTVMFADLVGSTALSASMDPEDLREVISAYQKCVAESTRRLLGSFFQLDDLGMKSLKGIGGPVRAWAVLRASSVEGRFEALHATDLTALVGREEETELLLRCWSKAKTGEGQVVLLTGEAGIGKSRLAVALVERLAGEQYTRLRYFCSPQHTNSALYPIIGQMEHASGLAHDDTPQARLDKLNAVLEQTSTSIEDAALFAQMLSLPNDGRYPLLDLTPQQRRQRTLEALTAQAAKLATQHPVLMIFEDAHWTDPTSLELLNRTVDRIKTVPALLIVTFRPEFQAPWAENSRVTSVTLNRLGKGEVAALIAGLVGNKELPADVMAEILERTDGIPLFVEEMTKAVLEAEGEVEARRTVAAIPSPALRVPASLHASLMARLHRPGPPKRLAPTGGGVGRGFPPPPFAAGGGKPNAKLEKAP